MMKATILAALLAGAAWTTAATPAAAGPWPGRDAALTGLDQRHDVWFGFGGVSAPEVVDLLYGRYGMARVMRVRPMGDVYEAEAIDRRGFRRHFVVDAYSGRILESFVVGRRPYEAAVPQPPGMIPGYGRDAMLPPGRLAPERGLNPEYGFPPEREPQPGRRAAPVRPAEPGVAPARPLPQQARRPDGVAPAPAVKAKPVPDQPKPSTVAPVPDKLPETAARPPQVEPAKPTPAPPVTRPADTAARPAGDRPGGERPAVKPVPVPPPAAAPAPLPPPIASEPPAQVRPAAPVARAPEPLIDPKTGAPLGRPGTAIPVAPLDDAVKVPPPSTPVPAATLE